MFCYYYVYLFSMSTGLGLLTLQVYHESLRATGCTFPEGHLMAAVSHPLWFVALKRVDGHCVPCMQRQAVGCQSGRRPKKNKYDDSFHPSDTCQSEIREKMLVSEEREKLLRGFECCPVGEERRKTVFERQDSWWFFVSDRHEHSAHQCTVAWPYRGIHGEGAQACERQRKFMSERTCRGFHYVTDSAPNGGGDILQILKKLRNGSVLVQEKPKIKKGKSDQRRGGEGDRNRERKRNRKNGVNQHDFPPVFVFYIQRRSLPGTSWFRPSMTHRSQMKGTCCCSG